MPIPSGALPSLPSKPASEKCESKSATGSGKLKGQKTPGPPQRGPQEQDDLQPLRAVLIDDLVNIIAGYDEVESLIRVVHRDAERWPILREIRFDPLAAALAAWEKDPQPETAIAAIRAAAGAEGAAGDAVYRYFAERWDNSWLDGTARMHGLHNWDVYQLVRVKPELLANPRIAGQIPKMARSAVWFGDRRALETFRDALPGNMALSALEIPVLEEFHRSLNPDEAAHGFEDILGWYVQNTSRAHDPSYRQWQHPLYFHLDLSEYEPDRFERFCAVVAHEPRMDTKAKLDMLGLDRFVITDDENSRLAILHGLRGILHPGGKQLRDTAGNPAWTNACELARRYMGGRKVTLPDPTSMSFAELAPLVDTLVLARKAGIPGAEPVVIKQYENALAELARREHAGADNKGGPASAAQ